MTEAISGTFFLGKNSPKLRSSNGDRVGFIIPNNPLSAPDEEEAFQNISRLTPNLTCILNKRERFKILYPTLSTYGVSEFPSDIKNNNLERLANLKPENIREVIFRLSHQGHGYLFLEVAVVLVDREYLFAGSYWIENTGSCRVEACGLDFPRTPENLNDVVFDNRISGCQEISRIVCGVFLEPQTNKLVVIFGTILRNGIKNINGYKIRLNQLPRF